MLVATEQHGGGSKRVFWLRAIGLVVLNGTASQMPTLLICSNPLSNSARDAKKTDQREMVRGFTAPQCPHIPCSKYRIPSMVMALITWHHLTLSQWPGTVMVQGRQSKLGFGDRLALGCQRPLVFLPPPPPTPLPPLELDGAAVVAAEDGGEEDDEDDEQMFFDTSAMEEPARRAPAMYRTLAKLLETGEVTVCGTHTHHTHKPHAHTTHAHKTHTATTHNTHTTPHGSTPPHPPGSADWPCFGQAATEFEPPGKFRRQRLYATELAAAGGALLAIGFGWVAVGNRRAV